MSGWPFYLALIVVCSLGHAIIWVRLINASYGLRWQKGFIKLARNSLYFILSGMPLLFILLTWQTIPHQGVSELPALMQGYLIVTSALGIIVLPILVIRHWFKKEPAFQLAYHNEPKNIAQELGYRPSGEGKRGWMATLPFNQAYEIELAEREIQVTGLPAALDGLRILHLSDLHFWGRPARPYFEKVLGYCSSRSCDLLVITGDLIDSADHYDWLSMLGLLSPSEAALAIRGNHDARYDAGQVTQRMERLGIQMIGGKARRLKVRGEEILVAGNEAPWLVPVPDVTEHRAANYFRLALIHCPDQFQWAKRNRFNLVLAGHNHGGQIRLPGLGSIFVPSLTGRRYDMGLFCEAGCVMHVSRGVSGKDPIRYFCRPEVTWLTLRQPDKLSKSGRLVVD